MKGHQCQISYSIGQFSCFDQLAYFNNNFEPLPELADI
jgi:hypothetical protein